MYQLPAMASLAHDLLDRYAILRQSQDGRIGLLATQIALILEALGSCEQFGVNRGCTDDSAYLPAQMIRGYWISQILGTLAQLGIPDQLAGGPMTADKLASSIACDPDATFRLLRASKAVGLVLVTGASGTLVAALLARNASLEGAILERPDVVSRARAAIAERGLSSRCRVISGDFFVSVPVADIHILKYIIHDWDDEQSVLILSNCARALRQKGRVVLVERVIPEDARPSWAPLVDLNMLAVLPGRERTEREYRDLLGRAGLRLDRITPTASGFSLVEASAT